MQANLIEYDLENLLFRISKVSRCYYYRIRIEKCLKQ